MAEQYKLSKTAAEINEKILNAAEIKTMTSAEYDLLPNPSSNTLYMLTDVDEETLTVDAVPVEGSTNPVASGGVHDALSALQIEVDGKADSGHTHTKSQITDFPTSMPASDVYSWAKASTKPTYTASEVGAMSNVAVTTSDNGKFLRVVNGAWAAASIPNAEEASF